MSVRSIFMAVAFGGLGFAGLCAQAEAGPWNVIYGYGNGMTYRAEAPWGTGNPRHGYGGWKGKRFGRWDGGEAYDNGSAHGSDYYAPAEGAKPLPEGTKPKLEPTPAPPVPDEREAMPRLNSPLRTVKHEAARN